MSYESETLGIRVEVEPKFSFARSDPDQGVFVFTYRVRIRNGGADTVQLLLRHWDIHDAAGEDSEVDGEGVIGRQPTLIPGDSHAYSSFCVLSSPVGHMEGYYTFAGPGEARFRVAIPRFHLEAPFFTLDSDEGGELFN